MVIFQSEFAGWQETVHLLSSPANAERMARSSGRSARVAPLSANSSRPTRCGSALEDPLLKRWMGRLPLLVQPRPRHPSPPQRVDRKRSANALHWNRKAGALEGRLRWLVVPPHHERASLDLHGRGQARSGSTSHHPDVPTPLLLISRRRKMSGSILLGDVAAKITADRNHLPCPSATRGTALGQEQQVAARHGPTIGMPDLLRILAVDCPGILSTSISNGCDVHCPTLSEFVHADRAADLRSWAARSFLRAPRQAGGLRASGCSACDQHSKPTSGTLGPGVRAACGCPRVRRSPFCRNGRICHSEHCVRC